MSSIDSLAVFLDGTRIGTVTQHPGGAVRFAYDDAYRIATARPTPLSLSMPIAIAEHSPKVTLAFLWGLLPDSEPTLQRWGREYGVSARNPFALLRHRGRDAAGAVQILPDTEDASDSAVRQGDIAWLNSEEFEELAVTLASHLDDWDPGRFAGRWSLAGAQPKIALFRDTKSDRWGTPRDSTPTTHIVKPAATELREHHLNEFLCLKAAALVGLPCANTEIIETARVRALVSERYDRLEVEGKWRRVHQEDLCQALSVHPSLKYQSDGGPGVAQVGHLLQRLRSDDRARNARRFLQALALSVLLGGTDAHAKNYSLLLRGSRVGMAPLYDVASMAAYETNQRLRSAMKIGDEWIIDQIRAEDWERAGRQLGVGAEETLATVARIKDSLPDALEQAVLQVPASMTDRADRMAARIVDHIQGRWRPLKRNPARLLR